MNWVRAYVGALLALVGGLLLLQATDVIEAGDLIGTWWPVALIGAGIVGFAVNPRHWAPPLILVVVGGSLLLESTDVMNASAVILPAVLVIVGLMLLVGRGFGNKQINTGDQISSFNMFSGSQIASHSPAFQGGTVGALFGGAEVDLCDSVPAAGARMNVFSAFGGVEVKVPQGWRVDISGMPIFGGFDNATTKDHLDPDAPELHIDATVLFGGLAVKH